MKDVSPVPLCTNDADNSSKADFAFQRYLRTESAWSWRAWVFFFCALVFSTMQAVPCWIHPDLRLGWDPSICYWIIGIAGAGTGFLVARYRFPGLLAGALAGTGSVLTAVILLEHINSFSRIVLVMVGIIGLLPGLAVYCILHVVSDNAKVWRRRRG
jgi:hypothetical protein